LGGVEDGGFEAYGGGASVEDGVDAAAEIVKDMLGGGRAGVAEGVGAWRGYGDSCGFEERLSCRVGWDADANERAAGGYGVWNVLVPRKKEG